MTNLTVEQFLTQPEPDEEDAPDGMYTWGPPMQPQSPLESIAATLDRMLAIAEHHELEETEADRLREAHDDLDAKHAVLYDLVEEIEAVIKPSTSKLANTVREAIGRWRGVEPAEEPAEEPAPGPEPAADPHWMQAPAKDAPVEEWRAHARRVGYEGDDLDQLNRSQIRTLLGVSQTEASA